MMQVTAEDVVELHLGLQTRGVQLWTDGGWGIGAKTLWIAKLSQIAEFLR